MNWLKANWGVVLGALIGGVLLWFSSHQQRAAVGQPQPAQVAAQVAREEKADTPIETGTVKAYSDKAKAKLPIPDDAKAKTSLKAISAVRVEADTHPSTVTTLLDTQTGETFTYTSRERPPLFALDHSGSAGIYYGWSNGTNAVRAEVRQAVFQVDVVHFGLIGSFDQPVGGAPASPHTFLGGGGWGEW
jgi:type IV secretory pathway VirB10-like protein